uniref:DNA-directed RNA polymerase III subunit RPC4 n=1 Tax=Ciona savignyi TaxID=51511 RepID=H2Z3E8_CIOSA
MDSNGKPTTPKIKEEASALTRPGRLKSASGSRSTEQSPSRLPSLRGPRDLTLGGIKKKTFSPVIPVRKDRVKQEVKEENKFTKQMKIKRERPNTRGRGRGRGRGFKQEIIQSHSIFEAGPTVEKSMKRAFGASSPPSQSQIQKPTIKKEAVDISLEKAESEETLKKLEAGNRTIIDGLENDEDLKPVVLPLSSATPPTSVGIQKAQTLTSDPMKCSDVFRCEEKLILLQIPDVLPGVPPCGEDEMKPDTKKSSIDSKDTRCSLDQLSEGRIGKLQLLKSGRCRLVLGEVSMDVRLGTPSSFAEELVSIRLPPEDSSESSKAKLSILGNVEDKLVCVPDIQSLVNMNH